MFTVSWLTEYYCAFLFLLGYFHQGLQLPGLLQHEQWFSHSLGTEGERWTKEVSHEASRRRFYLWIFCHSVLSCSILSEFIFS